MALLFRHLNDEQEGLRSTAALCCRNLYIARPSIQRKFIDDGGAQLLIRLLSSVDKVIIFETVLNIIDLILDDEDKVQAYIKVKFLKYNIMPTLNNLAESSNLDRETIEEVKKLQELFME